MTDDNSFKSILSYLPLLLPITLVYGIVKQVYYYKYFNLEIAYFLDFNEVLNLFFVNIEFMLALLATNFLLANFYLSHTSQFNTKSELFSQFKSNVFLNIAIWIALFSILELLNRN